MEGDESGSFFSPPLDSTPEFPSKVADSLFLFFFFLFFYVCVFTNSENIVYLTFVQVFKTQVRGELLI